MGYVEGSLARSLDVGEPAQARTAPAPVASPTRISAARQPLELLRGPDKYKVLEKRRRAAQISARHALEAADQHG